MRAFEDKRLIKLYITGLLLLVVIAGWFFIGANWFNPPNISSTIEPGETVDSACQAVYQRVQTDGFAGRRIAAQGDFKIEKAVVISGQEAKVRYNVTSTTPDTAQFCYVLVRGNIEVGSPFSNKTASTPTGHAIYDPQTLTYWEIGSGD